MLSLRVYAYCFSGGLIIASYQHIARSLAEACFGETTVIPLALFLI